MKLGRFADATDVGSNIFRIFSFFDKGNVVVLGNGFQKKSQKTPKQEIKMALKIMEEYQLEQEQKENKIKKTKK